MSDPHKHLGAAQMRAAIKGGEFVNHYQPKVDMESGAIVGVEALVRWIHPSHGMVMPDEFIADAESHGFLDEITKIVLENSLRQLRMWRNKGHVFDLSVNVSARTLCAPDFPELIERLATKAGIPLTSLVLEMTEDQLVGNLSVHLDTLIRLRLKGARLSLDDFGIGYSSLARLRDLPFDELKIDRSFVHHVACDSLLQAILEAVLRLARELGVRTVGEGVSNVEDWSFLRSAGCDVAQGYFVAKPMCGVSLESWAADWKLKL